MRTIVKMLRRLGLMIFCLIVMIYLGYHAVNGKFGLRALAHMEAEEKIALLKLDQIRIERQKIEARVALLRPESIDPDTLDERARAKLNFAHPDELIILRTAP